MEYLIIGILTGWVLSEIGEYRIRQNYKRQLKSADEHATFLLDVILDKQSHESQKPTTTTSKLPVGSVSERAELDKPKAEKYGWHMQDGFDDLPSGWMYEGGEDAYYKALSIWSNKQ